MSGPRIGPDEVWANVCDGGTSHRVLVSQLHTRQAALCGFGPPPNHCWMWAEGGKYSSPSRGKCRTCARRPR